MIEAVNECICFGKEYVDNFLIKKGVSFVMSSPFFLFRKNGLSLKTKFYFISGFIILMIMLMVAFSIYREYRLTSEDSQREKRELAEVFALSVINVLMYEDLGLLNRVKSLEKYIAQIMANKDLSIEYIVVTDVSGNIIAQNHKSWQLEQTIYSNNSVLGSKTIEKEINERNGPEEEIMEVSTPLASESKCLGTLKVGFSQQSLQNRLVKRYFVLRHKEMIFFAFGLFAINFIIIHILILKTIKPIMNLTDNLKEVGRGNLSIRSTFGTKDELGFLSEAFNSMMENLNQAREELHQTNTQMIQTEKMAAMGKLAAGLAHEINNPLGGVLTCVETLKQNYQDEEQRTKYFYLVQTGLERIRRTVKQLLNFGKQRSFQSEPTDINVLMNRTLEMTSHHLSSNEISIHRNFDQSLSEILGDPHQLIQVFVNLILNAIQAMTEGGELWIRTFQEDGRIGISIRDTGCGIPDENLDRIFDPFFSTKEPGQGTGLGLSVSYRIIQEHGGEITVESQDGIGSEFVLFLPVNHKIRESSSIVF
ncbi:MAG: ATP-binding protein [Thermodesulfobacteriota bacterium]|nr:ATP-binding protein [Thermodesulfobacteriota bacterium]